MPFSFVNPLFLFGLLAAGLPLLVHLLGRRKGRVHGFAAIAFLLSSEKKLAARRRIRNLLLLLVRMALVLALALAIARPLVRGAVMAGSEEPMSAVLVLDASASMGAVVDGETMFARARAALGHVIDGLPLGSEASVITLERPPRRVTPGFVSGPEARAALTALELGATMGRAGAALEQAAGALGAAHRERRLLYVASDLQATAWRLEELSGLGFGGAEIVLLDAGRPGPGTDIALVAVHMESGDSLEIEGLRSPPGGEPTEAMVRLIADGRLVNRGFLRFTADGAASTSLSVPADLPRGAEAVVEIAPDDALASDDRRHVFVERAEARRVVIGDGDPDADIYRDEVFYLERALETSGLALSVVHRDVSGGEVGELAGADVLVLANVERLSSRASEGVQTFVAAGGGLVVTMGDRVDLPALARALGPVLPARLRAPVRARVGEPPIALQSPPTPPHPVVAPFDSSAIADSLAGVRIAEFVNVESDPASEVLLRFTGGHPAVVIGRHGAGRVALLTTTVDRDWTDLPVRPAYVPLVTRLVAFVGGALEDARQRVYHPGDAVALLVDGAVTDLTLEGPGGELVTPRRTAPGRFEIDRVEAIGPYRAVLAGKRHAALDFVVNLDPLECDLTALEPREVQAALGPTASVRLPAELTERERETALPILIVLVLAFALEAWLGRPRGKPLPAPVAEGS